MNIKERLRVLSVVRALVNLKHFKKLRKNIELYKKYGVDRKFWQKLSYDSIRHHDTASPWLDQQVDPEVVKSTDGFSAFPVSLQEQLLKWYENGFVVLPGFFNSQRIDEAEQSIVGSLNEKEKQKYFSNRVINLYKKNKFISQLFNDPALVKILSFILGKEVAPFQTINFYKSGSQPAHSDAVHLTTEPLGFALGVWVAMEDVKEGSGEFFYYPGSHKLRYILNRDFATDNKSWILGEDLHEKYEQRVAELIEEKQMKYEVFRPKKGDVLIWHTNLLHGSLPKKDLQQSRRSLIMHYFAQGVLCYHEMLERPAVF